MAALRSLRVKRAIASLLIWCFAFAALEVPIADVHDGDATHAEVDRVTGASHADHGRLTDDQTPERPAPGSSDHPVHVCHCTHAHAGMLALPRVDLPVWEHGVPLAVAPEVPPPAVALAPPTHPPIV